MLDEEQADAEGGNARVLAGQNRALELNGAPLSNVLEVLVDTVEAQSEQERWRGRGACGAIHP